MREKSTAVRPAVSRVTIDAYRQSSAMSSYVKLRQLWQVCEVATTDPSTTTMNSYLCLSSSRLIPYSGLRASTTCVQMHGSHSRHEGSFVVLVSSSRIT